MKLKNEKFFKTKKRMYLHLIPFILMLILFIYLGEQNYNANVESDAFLKLYPKFENTNVFKAKKGGEIYAALNSSVIIVFGNSNNSNTEKVLDLVLKASQNEKIDEVYYYEFLNDRTNRSGNYELILEKLDNYVYRNDLNKTNIYAPTLLVIKEGKILYYNDEFAIIRNFETEESIKNKLNLLEHTLTEVFKEYKGTSDGV